jgi:hypothetical protein
MSATSAKRTPEQIRASLEDHRRELSSSIESLRDDVTELSDWRAIIRRHQQPAVIAAAVAGFVLAGGIGGITGIFSRSGD